MPKRKKAKGSQRGATEAHLPPVLPTPPKEAPRPAIREIGAAALKPVGAGANFTEFARIADGAMVVVTAKATIVKTHPLDVLHHRRNIEQEEFDAGERLMVLHQCAFGKGGYHSVNLDGFHGNSNYADNWRISQTQNEAMVDLRRAQKEFLPAEWQMLVGVCCSGYWTSEMARQCGIKPRKAMQFFRHALRGLSEYFRTGRRTTAPAVGEGRSVQMDGGCA